MARQIILIVLGSLLVVAEGRADDVREEVEKAKQVLQAAYNSGDADGIRQGTTIYHLSITTLYQFVSQADQLKALSDNKISSYEMKGLQVIPLTKDVVQLTFRADIDGTFQGRQMASKVRVVETWVKREGKWLQASYQLTPVGDSSD